MKEKILLHLKSDGDVGLHDFANICNALRSCLTSVGRCIEAKDDFAISDLEYGSAVLEISPSTTSGDAIAAVANSTLQAIEEGQEVDARLDYQALKAFQGFATPIRRKSATVTVNGRTLTSSFLKNIDAMVETDFPTWGSVTGRLEQVSVHGENSFSLFPPIEGEEVECVFDDEEKGRVLSAVEKSVTAYGKLFYARRKKFPAKVEVDSFEIHEHPEEELSDLLDARLPASMSGAGG